MPLVEPWDRSGALDSLGDVIGPDHFKRMHLTLPGNLSELLEWRKLCSDKPHIGNISAHQLLDIGVRRAAWLLEQSHCGHNLS
jgi:hypothetical protein